MLKNKPLIAKIGFDTAENDPSKVWVTKPQKPLVQLNSYDHGCSSGNRARADAFVDQRLRGPDGSLPCAQQAELIVLEPDEEASTGGSDHHASNENLCVVWINFWQFFADFATFAKFLLRFHEQC